MPSLIDAFLVSPIRHRAGTFISPFDDTDTFGSLGLGNDKDVWQKTIDRSFIPGGPYGNDRIEGVICPRVPGVDLTEQYIIGGTIYQDPPASMGGMRSFLADEDNPTPEEIEAAGANPIAFGTRCKVVFDNLARMTFTVDDRPWWIMGPGRENELWYAYLQAGVARAASELHSPFNRGIVIAGGNGGAHITRVFFPTINGAYTCIEIGPWNPNLGDENTIVNPQGGGYRGIVFTGGQALINKIISPSLNCTRLFDSTTAHYGVDSGQMGGSGDNPRQWAVVTGITALTQFTDTWVDGGYTFPNYRFSGNLTAPQQYWGITDPHAADPNSGVDRGVVFMFNVFGALMPGFGFVPFVLESYNPTTHAFTMKIAQGWLLHFYRGENLKADTDFENELAALPKIAAAYGTTLFEGPCTVRNTYSEFNGVTKWCRTNKDQTFEGCISTGTGTRMTPYAASTGDDKALQICERANAFVEITSGNVVFRDCKMTNPVIECFDRYADWNRVRFEFQDGTLINPNIRLAGDMPGSGETPGGGSFPYGTPARPSYSISQPRYASRMQGFGKFSESPFGPQNTNETPNQKHWLPRVSGTQHTPYEGNMPAAGHIGHITKGDLDAIAAITVPGTAIALAGQRPYLVVGPGATHAIAKHNGDFHSYYVDLVGYPWTFKGGTHIVRLAGCTDNQVAELYPGLTCGLLPVEGGWSFGTVWVVIDGIEHDEKYITVKRLGTGSLLLPGTKTATYSGTTIKQQPADIKLAAPWL